MSTDWKVYIYDADASGGGAYVIDDAALKRPNASLSMESSSTYSVAVLANGDKAFVIPEKTVHHSPLQFIWTDDDGTLFEQFKDYQESGYLLKVTTHNANYSFIGRVQTVVAEWGAGVTGSDGGDLFDVAVAFDVTTTLP